LLERVAVDLHGARRGSVLVALAETLYRTTLARGQPFALPAAEDPVWLMLLALHIAEARQEPLSVSALCDAAGVSGPAAFRHLFRHEDRDLVERAPDRQDLRRSWVMLTEKGRIAVIGTLATLHAELKAALGTTFLLQASPILAAGLFCGAAPHDAPNPTTRAAQRHSRVGRGLRSIRVQNRNSSS
jgi:DNA-binding MarR family transcriptional regulator